MSKQQSDDPDGIGWLVGGLLGAAVVFGWAAMPKAGMGLSVPWLVAAIVAALLLVAVVLMHRTVKARRGKERAAVAARLGSRRGESAGGT